MLHTTTIAVIAGGAVVLLLGIAALLRARRRRQRADFADLPALLYFAGNDTSRGDGAGPSRSALAVPGWLPARSPGGTGGSRAVAWAPAATDRVQLLPGCLRPDSGGEEIRFVARPGEQRFTLGRSRGPAHSHIQLSAPTVSRMHAWMELSDGEWRVGRLSQTNDVVLNGSPVSGDSARPLRDGDRLELGDTVFTFHHRATRAEASDDE